MPIMFLPMKTDACMATVDLSGDTTTRCDGEVERNESGRALMEVPLALDVFESFRTVCTEAFM
ncbi:MAG: hypothetical protein OQK24_08050 [Magnetovibrio sp.]|nr:hypothetical protein [Magnetovibrio sp.]